MNSFYKDLRNPNQTTLTILIKAISENTRAVQKVRKQWRFFFSIFNDILFICRIVNYLLHVECLQSESNNNGFE